MNHKVLSIVIYPIKGMKGSEVNSAKVRLRGFENDRRYMLIDKKNKFVSQRSHPVLTQIVPIIAGDEIRVSSNGESFSFSLNTDAGEVTDIKLFDEVVQGTFVSDAVDNQFSKIVGEDVRLVKMNRNNVRHKQLINGPESTEVSFADGYPYLIAGTASLDELNRRLDQPVLMDRFRPNIIISSSEPHIEDGWGKILIGKCELMVIKPCARCPVVTIDQQTGNRAKEPLKTLATYRKVDNNVYFGANSISLSQGVINIGDSLVAL